MGSARWGSGPTQGSEVDAFHIHSHVGQGRLAARGRGSAGRALLAGALGAALAVGTTGCAQSGRDQANPPAPVPGAVQSEHPSPSPSASSAPLPDSAALTPSSPLAPPGEPSEAVIRFVDAAARRDHAAMAQLFGTWEGPTGGDRGAFACALRRLGSWLRLSSACPVRAEVELRMDLMASILARAAYRVRGESPVAGRERPAVRVVVEARPAGAGPGASGFEVPFVVVKSRDGRWLVQEVALDRLTG